MLTKSQRLLQLVYPITMNKNLFSFAVVNAFKVALFVMVLGSCTSSTDSTQSVSNPTESQSSVNESASVDARKTILFFGDSITAGYGIEEEDAFPALIQKKLDSLDLQWKSVNAGL